MQSILFGVCLCDAPPQFRIGSMAASYIRHCAEKASKNNRQLCFLTAVGSRPVAGEADPMSRVLGQLTCRSLE